MRQQRDVRSADRDPLALAPIRRQFLCHQRADIGAVPARFRKERMRARQRLDAAFHRRHVIVDAFAHASIERSTGRRQAHCGRGDRPRAPAASWRCFGLLAIGDVDGDAADPHHLPARVDARRRGAGAPAHLAVGAHARGIRSATCARPCAKSPTISLQRLPVLGMRPARGHCPRRALKAFGIDAENAVLALVPIQSPLTRVPIPRAHLAGGQRQAAALLALQEPHVRGFELRRALGDAPLEFGVRAARAARVLR